MWAKYNQKQIIKCSKSHTTKRNFPSPVWIVPTELRTLDFNAPALWKENHILHGTPPFCHHQRACLGTGSSTTQFVVASSSIFRAQSSSTMLWRLGFMIASGWLLYISAVLPPSAQMCLNWEAPKVRNFLGLIKFWLKHFVDGRAWRNFNNHIFGSPASSHHYYCI